MENNQEPVTQTDEKTEVNVDTQATEKKDGEKEPEKTFTQADFNNFEKKLKKQYKEKYKGYDEWLESQKTEAEKQAEVLKENETLKNKILELENIQVVANAGVDSKFQKFVFSEVSGLEGDFEENLKDYIKENPQFLQTTTSAPQNTGVPVSKIKNSEEDGVMAILKSKHPEAF